MAVTTKYRLEIWIPTTRKYKVIWEGKAAYAQTTFEKSYHARYTRRLVRTEETLIRAEKARKR